MAGCATGTAPSPEAGDDAGYLIDEAEVTYWGLGPACQADHGEAVRSAPTNLTPATEWRHE